MSVTIFGIGVSGVLLAHVIKSVWNEIRNIGKERPKVCLQEL